MATTNNRKSGNQNVKDLTPKQTIKGGKVRLQDFHF
jgi:hypothetical protein